MITAESSRQLQDQPMAVTRTNEPVSAFQTPRIKADSSSATPDGVGRNECYVMVANTVGIFSLFNLKPLGQRGLGSY